MAAHQITINPLSGGIGTAPAGVVPYASDMWGVNAVRIPQVGTPSARTQAKAITVGIVRRATTGDVSISFTSKLSPPIRAPQWGTATLSFSSAVEADSCPSRSAFGTTVLASRRDVGVPSMAHLPALTGEPTFISIATVSPGGYPRDTVLGLTSLQTTTDISAHSLEHRSLRGTPLVSFGWDVAPKDILTVPAVPPLFEVCTETFLITPIAGVANIHEELRGIAVYTATATPFQGIIIPTTRIEGILNIIIPIAGTTRSIL